MKKLKGEITINGEARHLHTEETTSNTCMQ